MLPSEAAADAITVVTPSDVTAEEEEVPVPSTVRSVSAGMLGRRHRSGRAAVRGATGLSRGDVKRLARRGGVVRMGAGTGDTVQLALRAFLRGVIGDAVTFCEHSRRRTVYTQDVVLALKHAGSSLWHTVLYGYDAAPAPRRRRSGRTKVAPAPSVAGDVAEVKPEDSAAEKGEEP
jgi:histone H4